MLLLNFILPHQLYGYKQQLMSTLFVVSLADVALWVSDFYLRDTLIMPVWCYCEDAPAIPTSTMGRAAFDCSKPCCIHTAVAPGAMSLSLEETWLC